MKSFGRSAEVTSADRHRDGSSASEGSIPLSRSFASLRMTSEPGPGRYCAPKTLNQGARRGSRKQVEVDVQPEGARVEVIDAEQGIDEAHPSDDGDAVVIRDIGKGEAGDEYRARARGRRGRTVPVLDFQSHPLDCARA